MMIPPIVGVPALAWWPSGPSSRMFCPNSRTRRNEMNLGERKTQMSSAAVPPMRTSPMELGVVAAAEGVSGDGDVVEGLLAPVGELLALLVALARDDDDVAGPGE